MSVRGGETISMGGCGKSKDGHPMTHLVPCALYLVPCTVCLVPCALNLLPENLVFKHGTATFAVPKIKGQ